VATRSPLHAATVRDALATALTQAHAGRRDLHAVLEPLDELHAAAGAALRPPEARALVARFGGGSKTARLARSLLAREGEPGDGAAVALEMADARLARAERWAADASGTRG
jgi:hypothetical protein